MLINLMDPSLRIAAGHHLDLDIDIAKELARVGHDVRVYSHQDISADARALISVHAPLTPIFRLSPYTEPVGTNEDGPAEMAAFVRAANLLAEDLREVRRASLWIWPTLFHSQHYACVIANAGIPIKGCMMMEPTYLSSCGKDLWRHTLLEARKKSMSFELGVVEPALHPKYLPLTVDGRLKIYPFPYDRIHEPGRRRELSTVGFFGNQRDEKGVFLFEELIGKLLLHGFKVVLHDSSGGSQGTSSDTLRLVLGFVPNLSAEIITCDLVVVPYKSAEYQHKGSGIVWAAAANGIPIVAPYGSTPARLVESSGAGKLFRSFSTESVFQAILEAKRDYLSISDAACTVSMNWMRQHGIRNFVNALLDAQA